MRVLASLEFESHAEQIAGRHQRDVPFFRPCTMRSSPLLLSSRSRPCDALTLNFSVLSDQCTLPFLCNQISRTVRLEQHSHAVTKRVRSCTPTRSRPGRCTSA